MTTTINVGLTRRKRLDLLRSQLKTERSSFESHWRELNDFVRPRRARFYSSDVNRGDRRTQKIIDSTGTFSLRTMSAGMMSGVTSPARPWFRLTVPDPELAESAAVKEWLHEVTHRMATVFVRSNLYNALPQLYSDLGLFATAPMAVLEDDEDVIRCTVFPVGSYMIANDARGRVRTFVREYRMTALQVVEQWGMSAYDVNGAKPIDWTRISASTRTAYEGGNLTAPVDVVHVIQPNAVYDGSKFESRFKRFSSCYYEAGGNEDEKFLAEEGFDEFPVLAARWDVSEGDVYGTDCPGMTALGDVKQLQTGEKLSAQAIEKMVKPPLTGPAILQNAKVSLLPGDVTYADVREGLQGLRPIHEVKFDIAALEGKQEQVRFRIRRAFYEDLFLMLASSDRREITAREIDERHEEKLLALGPVLEQLNQDVLDPLIDRTFAIMARKGLIPEAPEEIQGLKLRVEYISVMAQAQKLVGLAGIERSAGFVVQIAEVDLEVLDNIDTDELARLHFDATGVPPKAIRSEDAVAARRSARAKAQQAAAGAENAPKLASAVRDLSQSPTGGQSALAALLGGGGGARPPIAPDEAVA